MKKRTDWKILIACLVIVFGISLIGGLFTTGITSSLWYLENKPSFNPPNWMFGPIWTILYLLIAISLYFVWKKSNKEEKKKIIVAYGVNLFANPLWSYLFFKLQNPLLALFDILVIFASIIGMIHVAGRIDKKATWLLIPYLLWVGFAAILNLAFLL